MGKNVAVFVDVANIFYAAKAAGVDIDYVTLLRSATAGRDFVRAYAYTGLDPENENQRNFHQFLARHSYKVVSKDIRKYGDGKVKANLDIELVVDLMKTARNLDIAVIVSGDGDFASAIRAVQEMGVRVEVVSFRGNTSSDLIDVADLFTDITQIAKVEKGSTRSGRRVTEDEEDLSMTEVPDKQSEGTGEGRGRGRGRTTRGGRGRGERDVRERDRDIREEPVVAAAASGRGLTALPGEKLSKVAAPAGGDAEGAEDEEPLDLEAAEVFDGEAGEAGEVDGDGRRRRRRRGGRGRGRGRAREDGTETFEDEPREAAPAAAAGAPAPAPSTGRGRDRDRELPTPFDDLDEPAPRRQPATPFGSVWDRQVGVPAARPASADLEPLPDEDFDEPAIPEYLIAERRGNRPGGQRGGGGGGQRGGRGRGGAYAAAIDRERYGRGGGSSFNRYPEPARGGTGGGGANRDRAYGGGGGGGRDRDRDRAPQARPSGGSRGSSDPWSEVPPELEELVRAQMARSKPSGDARPVSDAAPVASPPEGDDEVVEAVATPAKGRGRTRRTTTAAADAAPAASAEPVEAAAPKRRTTTRKAATATAPTDAEEATATAAAPKRRTSTRKTAAAADEVPAEVAVSTPARRTRRASTTATTSDAAPTATAEADAAPAPKRRTTRKPAAASTTEG